MNEFKNISVGSTFKFNGLTAVKQTGTTAKLKGDNESFNIGPKELVKVINKAP